MSDEVVRVNWDDLIDLCTKIFVNAGLTEEDAHYAAEVLTDSDARGIKSHGVARMHMYLRGLENGSIKTTYEPTLLSESATTISYDANGCLGQSVSVRLMNIAIEKARKNGIGIGVVRNSNHFGIAGYYAEMAAKENMIGLCLTNTAALGVPTFGRIAMFGTNPIAFAAPGQNGDMFSLDMATTVVPRGKIEVYQRNNQKIPLGWAVGIDGKGTTDPTSLLLNMVAQKGGGLMPLGGEGTLFSGYKGFGLAEMVDILTGVLSGGTFGRDVKDGEVSTARVCHYFMAIDISKFRDVEQFKTDMSTLLHRITDMPVAEGEDRVYYAGLKEHEREALSRVEGVTLEKGVWEKLCGFANKAGVEIPQLMK